MAHFLLVSFRKWSHQKKTHTHTFHMMSPQKKLVTHQQKSSKQITKIEIYKHFSGWTHDCFSRFFLRNSPYVFMFRWNFPTPAKQPSMKVQEVSSILGTHQKSWSRNTRSEFPRNENLWSLGDPWSHAAKRTGGENPGVIRDVVGWREGTRGWYNRRGHH